MFRNAAVALARELVKGGHDLVYGGASVGIMGVIADAVLAEGGAVIGVMPESLLARELAHPGLTELRVVADMHQRKAMMADLADGFIALPGGLGTLDELSETMTWAQLGMHQKPSGILNINGFYDELLLFLQRAVEEGFMREVHSDMLLRSDQPAELLQGMREYFPTVVNKWADSTGSIGAAPQ